MENLVALSQFLSKGVERSLPFFKVLKSCTDKKNIQWIQEAAAALQEMNKFMDFANAHSANTWRSSNDVSHSFDKKRKRRFICERGRRISSHLLRKQSPTGSRAQLPRTVKTHTSVSAHSEKAAKIFSGTYGSDPNQLSYQTSTYETQKVRANKETPKAFLIEAPPKDNRKEVGRKTDTKLEETKSSCEWKLYTDGASSFDSSGAGLMLIDLEDKEYTYALRFEFETTNNEAEYKALLAGLRIAQEMEIINLAIIIDSQLLKADALRKLASMTFEHLTKEVLVEVLARRSIEEKEVLHVETKEEESWMTLVYDYLMSGLLPEDSKESRKIRIKAPQYKLIREHVEIISKIKKQLIRSQQEWVENLPQVLWIHRRLPRNNQKETPFSLIYNSKAVILIVKNNVAKDDRGRTKEVTKRRESKEVASIEEAYYQNKLRRYHCKRSNHSTYRVGYFILLLQNNTKNPQLWQGPHMIREVHEGELYKIIDASDHSLITAK
uniref:Reverse transcriptase domain-containing protein n=1 Tax=Tanacetum cinerariifolium TaxID=118510 RepID=A0A6L2J9A4_TANCI|nr:reverse transcriptase domain-containing protein [Tanacetum cinerariifolium]